MGKRTAGHILIFNGKLRKDIEKIDKLPAYKQHGLAHNYYIGIVADVA